MSDHHRQVFILSELEQMSALDIAAAVNANVNTVYSRLRAARFDFERAVARLHTRRTPSERPVCRWSAGEACQLDMAKTLRAGNHVELDDPVGGHREGHHE
jgi:hypothetical protein